MDEKRGHPTAQCLLVAPRGYDVPVDLLDGLRRRSVQVREVTDAPTAMLLLARQVFTSLIILEPAAQPDAAALAAAVKRYYPRVVLWQYRWNTEPRLVHFGDAAPIAAPPPVTTGPVAPVKPPPQPTQRAQPVPASIADIDLPDDDEALMRDLDSRTADAPKAAFEPPDATLLSDDELQMLLGGAPPRKDRQR
jgi:hypothetical protein